jgi:dCMP deaminase
MNNTPDNYEPPHRPNWDEYFLMLAKLAATRSTCLAFPVGAVIAKDRQVLATGRRQVRYTVRLKASAIPV